MFINYSVNYHHSVISSKIILRCKKQFPSIQKIVVFFIINTKFYKKNILLFYIIVSLCFYESKISNDWELNNYYILKKTLKNKAIFFFFNSFISIYLPTLDFNQNTLKKTTTNITKKSSFLLYRVNYFNFPIIPESEFLCYSNEYIYNWINSYQIKIDIYLKTHSTCLKVDSNH